MVSKQDVLKALKNVYDQRREDKLSKHSGQSKYMGYKKMMADLMEKLPKAANTKYSLSNDSYYIFVNINISGVECKTSIYYTDNACRELCKIHNIKLPEDSYPVQQKELKALLAEYRNIENKVLLEGASEATMKLVKAFGGAD